MREVTADPDLVAYCGLYCGACRKYLREKCTGCHKNVKASWCNIRTCCLNAGYLSCAECLDYADPNGCRKFNNVISKAFGLIFRSNRCACINQIREAGIRGHAEKMAGIEAHTLKR